MNELSDGVTPPPLYSLVIPAHDEAGNVVPLLDEIHATLADTVSYEVIFVDDASRDATVAQLTPRIDGHQVRLVRHSQRCGKSAAIPSWV